MSNGPRAVTPGRPLIVGTGDLQFEVQHDWGRLPDGYAWGNTHGVAEDSQGRIYIKHTVGRGSRSPDAVVVFDADGRFVRSWGPEFRGGAHGLHLVQEGREEFLILCDPARHLVVKTTLEGREVYRFGFPEASDFYEGAGQFCPTNVAVAPNGDVYVADGYGKNFVHLYDANGSYRKSFGGTGNGRGQLSCPHGLMVDTRLQEPLLVVADRGNRRLQYFTLDGEPRQIIADGLRAPCHFHERNGLLVVPDLEARVTLLDRENRIVAQLGDGGHYQGLREQTRDQFVPGRFIAPHSACFDHAGNIFVVEWVEVGRVTKLRHLA